MNNRKRECISLIIKLDPKPFIFNYNRKVDACKIEMKIEIELQL